MTAERDPLTGCSIQSGQAWKQTHQKTKMVFIYLCIFAHCIYIFVHIYTHIWLPIYDSLIYIHICIFVQIYEYKLLSPFLLFDGMWNSISLWDCLRGSIAAWYHISPSDSSRGIPLQHLRAFYLFLILPSTLLVCFMMPQPIKMTVYKPRCQDRVQ